MKRQLKICEKCEHYEKLNKQNVFRYNSYHTGEVTNWHELSKNSSYSDLLKKHFDENEFLISCKMCDWDDDCNNQTPDVCIYKMEQEITQ